MRDTPDQLDTDEAVAIVQLRRRVTAMRSCPCVACAVDLCDHERLFSVALGFQDLPRCLRCLAEGMGQGKSALREQLLAHIRRRECYHTLWQEANQREHFPADGLPSCLWDDLADHDPGPGGVGEPSLSLATSTVEVPPSHHVADRGDVEWDAGDMGCGDLVLALRGRLQGLAPGTVLKLTALDAGAPEDIPAWCRLTGHKLIAQRHPQYFIERKEL